MARTKLVPYMSMIVSVALPVPLRRVFDYESDQKGEIPGLIPGQMSGPRQTPEVGMRVQVPFGRRRIIGIVVGTGGAVDSTLRYRPIEAILDDRPLVTPDLLELCHWAADYYAHPLGEVLAAALPTGLRHRRRSGRPVAPDQFQLTAAGRTALPALAPRAQRLRSLLTALADGPQPRTELRTHGLAALRRASDLGWIEPVAGGTDTSGGATRVMTSARPALTIEQNAALAELRAGDSGFSPALLDGVTGSGKTELYLRLAEEMLQRGRQVLVLVPEIGLTPQLVRAFVQRFGARVASYHSALGEAERARNWVAASEGQADILVGTRSAVFVPMARLGLIIVDEEHDTSFKQSDGFRYSARDVAVRRAQKAQLPIVLGTATPSLESLANAQAGRYRHVRLSARVSGAAPPTVGLVDLRGPRLIQDADGIIAEPLLEVAARHLEAGDQVLFFVNRRGYAPALLCHTCGWATACPHCDARMVWHRSRRRLICHHCGSTDNVPAACPDCGAKPLQPVGQGTERIEDLLCRRFPGLRIERFDSDRLARAGEMERLLADAHSGAIRILVGTQMLAKGHDFANLGFVGILDVDQALFGTDFRALERMGQLVTQVAGRVGRAGQPGEVLLQTHQPEHPLLRTLVQDGYPALAAALLAERKVAALPPYAHLALIRAEARSEGEAMNFLNAVRQLLPLPKGVDALGPVPAPMERRAGHFRAQLLLRGCARNALHALLRHALPNIEALDSARKLRWSVDVDPADLF